MGTQKFFRKVALFLLFLVTWLVIFAYNAVAGTTELPRTGQTQCYDANRNKIDCAGTGQDGDIRAGAAWPIPRFKKNSDATVRDRLTGLAWPTDAGTPSVGLCDGGYMTWVEAFDYIQCLNKSNFLGYSDWRLPNINELKSLFNGGQEYPSEWLKSQGFERVYPYWYWSSTTYAPETGAAWFMSMGYGHTSGYDKNSVNYVWPVRGGYNGIIELPKTGQIMIYHTRDDGALQRGATWPSPRFVVNGNCVTDNLTGLMWAKDAHLAGMKLWNNALSYVNNLSLCGFVDWRLPNSLEIGSLIDYSSYSPALSAGHPFIYVQPSKYWSSSTATSYDTAYAWISGLIEGDRLFDSEFDSGNKGSAYKYAWPVRGGRIGPFNDSDIAVSVASSPDPVVTGKRLTYTITITNNGPDTATGVSMTDLLPSGVVLISTNASQGSCYDSADTVSCDIGNVGNGENVTVSIVVTAPETAGPISNTTVISCTAKDPDIFNNIFEKTTMVDNKPTLGTLTPSYIASAVGEAKMFTAVYNDADGYEDLRAVDFLVSPTGTGANAIWVRYDEASNQILLYDDAGVDLISVRCAPGADVMLFNKQGRINCARSSVTKTGDSITVKWNIVPKAAFANASIQKKLKMKAVDKAGLSSGWAEKGSWVINP